MICIGPLDRASRIPLADQLTEVLRTVISKGAFPPGSVLPGVHELAELVETSEKVPRLALARLAAEGWIRPRRHVGSVVLDRGRDVRIRGRVLLYFLGARSSYYPVTLGTTLCQQFVRAGYRVSVVSATVNAESASCHQMEVLLKERWDLVVESGYRPRSRALIENAGWPFVILGDGARVVPSSAQGCLGEIGLSSRLAVPNFIRAAVRLNVHTVWQFVYDGGPFDVTEMLNAVGISVRTIRISRRTTLEEVTRASLGTMRDLLSARTRRLPDVIFFTDDYLAQGGLLAISATGLSIPEDVRVVTMANSGLGPIWFKPLTRIEMDPVAHGKEISRALLDYLKNGVFPSGLEFGSVWCSGQTF